MKTTTTGTRTTRLIGAVLCLTIGCALLLLLDPSMRYLRAGVSLEPHSGVPIASERALSSNGSTPGIPA